MTHVNRILSICTLALSCASVLAANAPPPPVAWTAHDISGNEVRVPVAKPAAGPAVLLFAMAGLIGTVVIGMLLPIFTVQELVK